MDKKWQKVCSGVLMSVTSERLKNRREQLGYTQDELAELILGTQKQIWMYESGRSLPSAEKLMRFAKVLETSVDWLLGLTDDTNAIFGDGSLDSSEIELLRLYRQKSPDSQHKLLDIARVL